MRSHLLILLCQALCLVIPVPSPVVSVTKLARIKSMPCLFIVNPPLGLTDLLMSSLCINFNCRKVYLSLPTALLIILLIRVSIIQVMTMWRLVDPNIDQCEGDVSSMHMGIATSTPEKSSHFYRDFFPSKATPIKFPV